MPLSPVSAYHLNSKLYEPSRSNCFEFIVNDDLNKLLFAGKNVETDTAESDYLTGIQGHPSFISSDSKCTLSLKLELSKLKRKFKSNVC